MKITLYFADSTTAVPTPAYSCSQMSVYQSASGNIEYCSIMDTTGTMTWPNADAACKSLNYTLATIDTADKFSHVWTNDYWLMLVG